MLGHALGMGTSESVRGIYSALGIGLFLDCIGFEAELGGVFDEK
ncbi:hypothetical protein [Desulfosporosinus nitroreducens]|nr:hypothetical protein [Desulfosporosinus nitroreducens]